VILAIQMQDAGGNMQLVQRSFGAVLPSGQQQIVALGLGSLSQEQLASIRVGIGRAAVGR